MFSKALIATDLSPASFSILGCCRELKEWGTRECLLLQCLNLRRHAAAPDLGPAMDFLEANLADQKKTLEGFGFAVAAEVVSGLAQVEINRIARERGYSLVVVGSHGRTLAAEMLLGGVASAVIHHAARLVLLIRIRDGGEGKAVSGRGGECRLLDHLLFPTDFSKNSEHALTYLLRLVESGARRVTILHVQDRDRIDPHLQHRLEEFNRIDRERLEKIEARLRRAGAGEVKIVIPFGRPASEILGQIETAGISLAVMGSQGRGFVSEIFLGSVSHEIARRSPVPVLLIPAPR